MNSDTPIWQPFHPERGRLPRELQHPLSPRGDGTGQVIVISAIENADEAQWGARAAIRIAREWAASGTRVFLADLGFDAPVLHTLLGEENREGLSDALLYGASIQHIACPQGEGFFFGSAGTPVADSDRLLRHDGWDEIIEGFLSAGVTLVLFAPTVSAEGPFQRADYRVILTGAGTEPGDIDAEAGTGRVLAILSPGSSPENGSTFEPRGAVTARTPEDAAAAMDRQERARSLREEAGEPGAAQAAVPMSEGSEASQPAPTTADTSSRGVEERKARGRKGRDAAPKKSPRPLLMLILLILLGGILAAGYLGFVEIPGITPASDPGGARLVPTGMHVAVGAHLAGVRLPAAADASGSRTPGLHNPPAPINRFG